MPANNPVTPTPLSAQYKCVIPSCGTVWNAKTGTLPQHVPNNPHTEAEWTSYANTLPVGQRTNYPRFILVGYTVPPKPPQTLSARNAGVPSAPNYEPPNPPPTPRAAYVDAADAPADAP